MQTTRINAAAQAEANDAPGTAASPQQTGRLIRPAEVLAHSTQGDCWVVADGHVLEISSFIQSHPGGIDKIMSLKEPRYV